MKTDISVVLAIIALEEIELPEYDEIWIAQDGDGYWWAYNEKPSYPTIPNGVWSLPNQSIKCSKLCTTAEPEESRDMIFKL